MLKTCMGEWAKPILEDLRVDVEESCTVDVACACERGWQPYVFPIFSEL